MSKEIKFYGRGGQGLKTLAFLFAETAFANNMKVQAFPEYGPERMGAPVHAFCRISEESISLHSAVERPGIAVVLDASLLENAKKDLKKRGIILLNAGSAGKKKNMYVLDAWQIGKNLRNLKMANMVLLGALVKIFKFDLDKALKAVKVRLRDKFDTKLLEISLKAIKKGYEETK